MHETPIMIDEDVLVKLILFMTKQPVLKQKMQALHNDNYPSMTMAEDFPPEFRNDAQAVRVADLSFLNFA